MIITLSLQSWLKNIKKQFTYLGENTEKHIITFTVPIEKKVAGIDRNGQ